MNLRRSLIWVSVVIAVCAVAWVAASQFLSPGQLSRAHREVEGDNQCTRCHSAGRRVDTEGCVRCHGDIGRQRAQKMGLHGKKFRDQDCGGCHVEHLGLSHTLVRWPGGRREAFPHQDTGFALRGGHVDVTCNKCHDRRNERGVATFLGLRAACASCHEDPHDGRFGERCLDCHNEQKFKPVNVRELDHFDHARTRFALIGAHQQVECVKCHDDPPKYRGIEFQTCGNCHEDVHRGRFGADCKGCHTEVRWNDLHMRRSAHPGLSLAGGHQRVACRTCHDEGLMSAPSRGSRCVDCHRQVHEANFGNNCNRCHRGNKFLGIPEEIGREAHGLTAFALHGRHETVACDACHDPKKPPAERFRGLSFEQCKACHADPHPNDLLRLADGDCAACHDDRGFSPTRFSVEQHAATAFPLIGAHVATPCQTCHPSAHPRLDFRIADQACASCHQNPHGDQFQHEMAVSGCAHCHSPVAFNRPNIDHNTWPLTGAHGDVACESCHTASAEDRRAGRGASFRGVARECEGCHQDVHAGQFRLTNPTRQCADCHTTQQFTLPQFDHSQVAHYALEGEHAGLACAACHKPVRLQNGVEAVHYRLGYRRCNQCHADPHVEPPQ